MEITEQLTSMLTTFAGVYCVTYGNIYDIDYMLFRRTVYVNVDIYSRKRAIERKTHLDMRCVVQREAIVIG